MKTPIIIAAFFVIIVTTAFTEPFANDFMNIGSDIRSAGMGKSVLSIDGPAAVLSNPSRILSGNTIAFAGHEQLYQGLLISDAAGYSADLGSGKIAVGVLYAGGGGIKVTKLPDPTQPVSSDNRPYEVAEKGHHDFAVIPGYALSLNEKLDVGASVGLLYRRLVENSAWGGQLSLGADWRPIDGLSIGGAVTDIGYTSWDNGTNEFGGPNFGMAFVYDKALGLGFIARLCAEGQYLLQEEEIEGAAGIEISYGGIFSMRAGTKNGTLTAGADLTIIRGIKVGAAIGTHSDLPISYRIGATIGNEILLKGES